MPKKSRGPERPADVIGNAVHVMLGTMPPFAQPTYWIATAVAFIGTLIAILPIYLLVAMPSSGHPAHRIGAVIALAMSMLASQIGVWIAISASRKKTDA